MARQSFFVHYYVQLPSPLNKVGKGDAMGVALSTNLGRLQDASITQLHQNFLPIKLAGLLVIVGLDAAHEMWLPGYHLRQQVHQGVLKNDSSADTQHS